MFAKRGGGHAAHPPEKMETLYRVIATSSSIFFIKLLSAFFAIRVTE